MGPLAKIKSDEWGKHYHQCAEKPEDYTQRKLLSVTVRTQRVSVRDGYCCSLCFSVFIIQTGFGSSLCVVL